jgi:hypothetical protein
MPLRTVAKVGRVEEVNEVIYTCHWRARGAEGRLVTGRRHSWDIGDCRPQSPPLAFLVRPTLL